MSNNKLVFYFYLACFVESPLVNSSKSTLTYKTFLSEIFCCHGQFSESESLCSDVFVGGIFTDILVCSFNWCYLWLRIFCTTYISPLNNKNQHMDIILLVRSFFLLKGKKKKKLWSNFIQQYLMEIVKTHMYYVWVIRKPIVSQSY